MHRPLSLFDRSERDVLSVSRLARALRKVVESRFDGVWVEGEISNFKRHSSGHCYFTLKDEDAQIRGVMFRSNVRHIRFRPDDGMLVRVYGSASVYEARGDLQIIVRTMELSGEGALQKSFQALKRRLAAEGLFAREHKQKLPPYPEVVGIVTSDSGAALHDIISILRRRFPHVRVMVCSVQVQGTGAAEGIRDAIHAFNRHEVRPDVLIVGRGGGSLEDLWAFNEETVARAIFASTIPVISAVGHETDVSIADFVADARAATPSMAAELAVPDRQELLAVVRGYEQLLTSCLQRTLMRYRQHVRYLTSSHSFRRPVDLLHRRSQEVDDLVERLMRSAERSVDRRRMQVQSLLDRIRLLGPERPLEKGYVLVEKDGAIVRRAGQLSGGDAIQLRFHDGSRRATVDGTDAA